MTTAADPDNRPVHHLEDLEPGRHFVTSSHVMDAADIHEFAARYDPQPFHLDAQAAARHPVFRGLSASGWHTAAVTMRLLTTTGPRLAGGVIGLGGEVTWPRPVRAGDELTVHCEVTERRRSRKQPDRGIVTLRCETRNGAGEVVQVLLARLLVLARDGASDAATPAMAVTTFPASLPPAEEYLPAAERILAGAPVQRAWELYASADRRFSCGVWECAPGKWRVVFDENEFCELLAGEILITGDDGHVRHVRTGEAFVTPAGFTGTWEVLAPARKRYAIYR
jgi:acyl dehydratase/uncharacterized cupin superfamily protein